MPYDNTVFINCPFEKSFKPVLERLLFILCFYEFDVTISSNYSSYDDRLGRIVQLIKSAKWTFHDLSLNRATGNRFARFNMPFELGIDFGLRSALPSRSNKVICVLDKSPHDYDVYISDLSGRDIIHYGDDPDNLFIKIPEFLTTVNNKRYHGSKILTGYFKEWKADFIRILRDDGHDMRRSYSQNIYKSTLELYIPEWKKQRDIAMP